LNAQHETSVRALATRRCNAKEKQHPETTHDGIVNLVANGQTNNRLINLP
jgi:hypothetical protein